MPLIRLFTVAVWRLCCPPRRSWLATSWFPLARKGNTVMPIALGRVGAVVAGASVLVILGGAGGAIAGSLITSANIKDETIKARDIGPDAVTRSEVRNGAL